VLLSSDAFWPFYSLGAQRLTNKKASWEGLMKRRSDRMSGAFPSRVTALRPPTGRKILFSFEVLNWRSKMVIRISDWLRPGGQVLRRVYDACNHHNQRQRLCHRKYGVWHSYFHKFWRQHHFCVLPVCQQHRRDVQRQARCPRRGVRRSICLQFGWGQVQGIMQGLKPQGR
jgi:hypothetical protein